MTITIDHRALSALAKINTTDLKHSQRLQAFGKVLGFSTAAALMTVARSKDLANIPHVNAAPSGKEAAAEVESVTAHVWTDDLAYDLWIDASGWISSMNDAQLLFLAKSGFKGGATRALVIKDSVNGYINAMKHYLNSPLHGKHTVDFQAELRPEEVILWVSQNRPELHADFIKAMTHHGEDAS